MDDIVSERKLVSHEESHGKNPRRSSNKRGTLGVLGRACPSRDSKTAHQCVS